MKGQLQEMVLHILSLRMGATIREIRTEMEQWRRVPVHGTIFTTLTRLRKAGMVVGFAGKITPYRGGKAQTEWYLTDAGRRHLAKTPWALR